MKMKESLLLVCVVMLMTYVCGISVYTVSRNVMDATEGVWGTASQQIKTVMDNVMFPAIGLILAMLFLAGLGTVYFDCRKRGQFGQAAPAILFVCLAFTLTAPLHIRQILGM